MRKNWLICAEDVGRGKRIRTSGPCLPKRAASAVSRRNSPLSSRRMGERAGNRWAFGRCFTGGTPEPHPKPTPTARVTTNRAPMDGPNLPADWSPNDPHWTHWLKGIAAVGAIGFAVWMGVA